MGFALHPSLLGYEMVEAAGIEPASENHRPKAPTCLSPHLVVVSSGALGRAPESTSPAVLALPLRAARKDQPEL